MAVNLDSEDNGVFVHRASHRYGAFSFIHDEKLFLLGKSEAFEGTLLESFSLKTGWRTIPVKGDGVPRQWTGIQGCILNQCLYVYGGFCGMDQGIMNQQNCYRYNELRRLSLDTYQLDVVPVKDSASRPTHKDKYGCVAYENSIYIFGGYGKAEVKKSEESDIRRDWGVWSPMAMGWTNEFHAMDVSTLEWKSVETSGPKPPPCAAFSFTQIDPSRVVLFGGRQMEYRVNDFYLLDLSCMTWQGPYCPSAPGELWPVPRSFHTAVALQDPSSLPAVQPKPKIVVHWGMDNRSDPIDDAWILDVDSKMWTKVDPVPAGPRLWHCASGSYSGEGTRVFIFGGCKEGFLYNSFQEIKLANLFIAQYGVPTLGCAVLRFITSHWNLMEKQLELLPAHLKQVVRDYRHMEQAQMTVNEKAKKDFDMQ